MTLTAGYCLGPHAVFEIMSLHMPTVIYAYDDFRQLFDIFYDQI